MSQISPETMAMISVISIIIAVIALAIAFFATSNASKKGNETKKLQKSIEDLQKKFVGFDPRTVTEKANKIDNLERRISDQVNNRVDAKLGEILGANLSSMFSSSISSQTAIDKITDRILELMGSETSEFMQMLCQQIASRFDLRMENLSEQQRAALIEPILNSYRKEIKDVEWTLDEDEWEIVSSTAFDQFKNWFTAELVTGTIKEKVTESYVSSFIERLGNEIESIVDNRWDELIEMIDLDSWLKEDLQNSKEQLRIKVKEALLETAVSKIQDDISDFVDDNWDDVREVMMENIKPILDEALKNPASEYREKIVTSVMDDFLDTLENN